jgi:hypothetical protein
VDSAAYPLNSKRFSRFFNLIHRCVFQRVCPPGNSFPAETGYKYCGDSVRICALLLEELK